MSRRLTRPARRRATVVAAIVLLLGAAALPLWAPATAKDQPLRYLGGEPGTLDPARINDAGDVQLLLQVYAGLTRLDEQGNPYPSLASGWDVSPDGLTYTFHIRDGLRFSDGSPLDATDVRRSWLRLLDPAVQATAPDVLNVISGATDRIAGRVGEDGVGITTPDAHTLVVTLRHPAGYFPAIIATPSTFVVPRTATSSGTWQSTSHFVGSGPYTISGLTGSTLVLTANPDYAGAQPPIHEVDWVTSVDGDPVTAYSNQALDLAQIAGSDATWIAYDRDLGPALHQAAALSVQYLGFDTTRAPFDDPRVRRAFALALDKARLVSLSEGSSAEVANSIVPPALQPAGFSADTGQDITAANALLAEAGYANPASLGTITVNGTGLGVAPIVATWRAELGVTVDVETMAFNDYIGELDGGRTPQIFTINWVADYPSPHALYDLLLSPAAHSNYGHWQDQAFADRLDAAAAATTPSAQANAYAAVEAEVDAQVPLIPWAYDRSSWLVRPGLRGLGDLTVGLLDFGLVSWGG
jgi:oligopeptide transport system substrate-binding protein